MQSQTSTGLTIDGRVWSLVGIRFDFSNFGQTWLMELHSNFQLHEYIWLACAGQTQYGIFRMESDLQAGRQSDRKLVWSAGVRLWAVQSAPLNLAEFEEPSWNP